jgi:hypothetical protein
VFVSHDGVWTQQQKLIQSGGEGYNFGGSVSVDGDTALVGASVSGKSNNHGSVWVFVRHGSVWNQQQILTAAPGDPRAFFGYSVAVSGNTAVIGAPYKTDFTDSHEAQGAAFVFVRDGGVWAMRQQLTYSGATGDLFGGSVALSGDTAVIGAPGKSNLHVQQGAVYVFLRSNGVFEKQQELTAADGAAGDRFGLSTSVSGDTAAVGAYLHVKGASVSQGAAYVFARSASVWTQQQELEGSSDKYGNNFGVSLSVSGDTALIGAPTADSKSPGAAYVFVN